MVYEIIKRFFVALIIRAADKNIDWAFVICIESNL